MGLLPPPRELEGLVMRIKVVPEPFEEELNELPLHP